jgi:hypothetical protein
MCQVSFGFVSEYQAVGVHPFERAGLGKAPFRYLSSYRDNLTCCDYCGTAIVNVFIVGSADGQRFKVGCECIRKVDDGGLAGDVELIVRERQRWQRRYGDRKIKLNTRLLFH